MKACNTCAEIKPFSEYGSHARMRDGLQTRCRCCTNARNVVLKGGGRLLAQRAERAARPDEWFCSKCKTWKPNDAFNKSTTRSGGREDHCKQCRSAYRIARYRSDPSREKEKAKVWRANNLAIKASDLAAYRARKRQAMPVWAKREKIDEFYRAAAILTELSGEPWHVDHVIPLRGKTVCGLHCEQNLQLLPGSENQSKGNKLCL